MQIEATGFPTVRVGGTLNLFQTGHSLGPYQSPSLHRIALWEPGSLEGCAIDKVRAKHGCLSELNVC